MRYVTCCGCGWVHMAVSRRRARAEVDRFNRFFDTLTVEQRQEHYGNQCSSIQDYEHCRRCGGSYIDFREFVEGDCPRGCTIGPVIDYLARDYA